MSVAYFVSLVIYTVAIRRDSHYCLLSFSFAMSALMFCFGKHAERVDFTAPPSPRRGGITWYEICEAKCLAHFSTACMSMLTINTAIDDCCYLVLMIAPIINTRM